MKLEWERRCTAVQDGEKRHLGFNLRRDTLLPGAGRILHGDARSITRTVAKKAVFRLLENPCRLTKSVSRKGQAMYTAAGGTVSAHSNH